MRPNAVDPPVPRTVYSHLAGGAGVEKGGFRIVRQGKHIVMSDGSHFITIPRHNPVNALTMAGLSKTLECP